MQDDSGRNLSEAKPGDAVQVLGIPVIPAAGDFIYQVEDENKAKYIITKRRQVTSDSLHREQ
jgi:translation initiation factor IF-2